MAVAFPRTLRAVATERSRAWLAGLVAVAVLLMGWSVWFVSARMTLYEVTPSARIETAAVAHPVEALISGRVVASHLELGAEVERGDPLVVLDVEAQRHAFHEGRARLEALRAQLEPLRREL